MIHLFFGRLSQKSGFLPSFLYDYDIKSILEKNNKILLQFI